MLKNKKRVDLKSISGGISLSTGSTVAGNSVMLYDGSETRSKLVTETLSDDRSYEVHKHKKSIFHF